MALDTSTPFSSSDPPNEYGSDWDEELVDQLISNATEAAAGDALPLVITDIEDYETPYAVRLPKVLGKESRLANHPRSRGFQAAESHSSQVLREGVLDPDVAKSPPTHDVRSECEASLAPEADAEDGEQEEPDLRPPLERFRAPPKKPLSVTDLVSPAWCELQYFYTLSKHGKKRRTPAMRQGSRIHKALEDEVHRMEPVTVLTKEDGWGLRVWNAIQGLRTLKETGRTRELEVWGLVDGQFVNGVVDELSYTMPDPKGGTTASKLLPESQQTIKAYFAQHAGGSDSAAAIDANSNAFDAARTHPESKTIYLTDVKTRSSRSIPDIPSTLPTQFQLFIYHYFIEQLARGSLPLQTIAERYGLDVHATFSDTFIAEVGSLNEQYQDAVSTQESSNGQWEASNFILSQDSIDLLTGHNSLSSLWDLMLSYYRQVFTIPRPQVSEGSVRADASSLPVLCLSPILTATYLASDTAELIGYKTFRFDQDVLDAYLRSGMQWWRGERPPKGVDLSEVNRKCRWCDFREECEWLQERDLANLRRVREKWRERDAVSVV